MIKQKTGICIDCPPGSAIVPITGKRCHSHYWRHRQSVNAEKSKERAKDGGKPAIKLHFASQVMKMPRCCEESGQILPTFPAWLKLSCCAHILPKRKDYGFPSVATHPMNMIFLHPDIHNSMDNFGREYILKMKSLPIMKERVKILLPLLTVQELNRVPDYFL